MRNLTLLLQLLVLTIPGLASAQTASPTGSVMGRVSFAGSNLPVRNARVTLEAVPQLTPPKAKSAGSMASEGVHTIVETLPDGTFRFTAIQPGSYYVLVDKLGSLSPISVLTLDDLAHPSEQGLARMAQLLTGVTVIPNKTVEVQVQLRPGAILAGTIRFDDGSPATAARVQLMVRDAQSKWTVYRTTAMGSYNGDVRTDDRGQYRISGLPAGEYVLRTPLEVTETKADFVFGESGGSSTRPIFSLYIYQDGTFRPADAKPIKLTDAEDSEGDDIAIPIGKLHSLSGTLNESRTGHRINAGKVSLIFPDSEDELASTELSAEDSQFHFDFVPEGTYTFRIVKARDVTREVIAYPKGTMPPTHTEEKIIKTYADASQPIVLKGDESAVMIPIPQAPAEK